MEKEEEIKIPVWILEEIDDALRLTAKIYKCSERNTCWQRNIMQAYNMTRQLLETGKYEYSVSHRMRVGQTPNKEDYKNHTN